MVKDSCINMSKAMPYADYPRGCGLARRLRDRINAINVMLAVIVDMRLVLDPAILNVDTRARIHVEPLIFVRA